MAAAHQCVDLENVHPNEQKFKELVVGKKQAKNVQATTKTALDCVKTAKTVTERSSKTEVNDAPVRKQASGPLATINTNIIPQLKREVERIESSDDNIESDSCVNESMELDTMSYESLSEFDPTCGEYSEETNLHLHVLEIRHAPRWDYMSRQLEINLSMRSILVNWLVSVAEEYNVNDMTLHKTVIFLDRFLSRMSVAKQKFQLVGVAALLVASKYEEVYPPTAKEMVHVTADSYTMKQMLQMEQMMFRVLDFELGTPTALSFLAEYCRKREEPTAENLTLGPVDPQARWLAQFLTELCLLHGGSFLRYAQSCLAAAALTLAEYTLDKSDTPTKTLMTRANRSSLCSVSGYSLQQLSPVMARQNATFRDSPTSPNQAVVEKYRAARYASVALLRPRELLFDDL